MNYFLICPVRQASDDILNTIHEWTNEMESLGHTVYYPARDTNQDDKIGYRICNDNMNAIINADVVAIIWDGMSTGCLFDMGMAFALHKNIVIVSLPPYTKHKSFQNMLLEWKKQQKSKL